MAKSEPWNSFLVTNVGGKRCVRLTLTMQTDLDDHNAATLQFWFTPEAALQMARSLFQIAGEAVDSPSTPRYTT